MSDYKITYTTKNDLHFADELYKMAQEKLMGSFAFDFNKSFCSEIRSEALEKPGFTFTYKLPYRETYIPKKIFFNGRNTTVEWGDGSKTTVRATDQENFTEEGGVAMCIVKKLFTNRQDWLRLVKGATRQFSKEQRAENAAKKKAEKELKSKKSEE